MDTPWHIVLELDRATTTERDVKAAYARLLKLHRPDTDPAGFRRVRSAYEQALAWMQTRATEPEDDDFFQPDPPREIVETPPPRSAEATRADAARDDDILRLREAIAGGGIAPLTSALVALATRRDADMRERRDLAATLRREFQGRSDLLAIAAPDSLLTRLLAQGDVELLHDIISEWEKANRKGRAAAFATVLIKEHVEPADEAACQVLGRVAHFIAFERHDLAQAIADKIYPHLSPATRVHAMNSLESVIAIGRLFHGFPVEVRRFWQERLTQREATVDWNSPPARQAVDYVMNIRGHSWDGLPLVQQIVPDGVWKRMERTFKSQVRKASRSGSRFGDLPLRLIWILVIVFINAARTCEHRFDGSSRYPEVIRQVRDGHRMDRFPKPQEVDFQFTLPPAKSDAKRNVEGRRPPPDDTNPPTFIVTPDGSLLPSQGFQTK